MRILAKNKTVKKFVKRMLWIKKHQPAKYYMISTITDGMVMGAWVLISGAFALWMVNEGYATVDSALMGLCLVDLNILMISFTTDIEYPDHET